MPRIHQLDASIINKIAAGEVIERPANVVKELLENSIDALATRVEVDVAQGGADLIRVVDDGEGIHPDDLLLTVTSHATSKIASADDLFQVQTMGFRGEALASIAEVSRLRLRSRQADAVAGVELEVNCGRVSPPQACGCPIGTSIEIRQLFANTPVRRKFLKTTATEFGHISEQFTRIALAHPRLHMVLRHNQKIVYELPASGQLIDRLRLFYGGELADDLIWVESTAGDVRMWGYVGHPRQSKSTRKGQYLFLNGRWIQDRSLQHALGEAYRGLLMVGRQPIAFLFLDMPPSLVDVNVHPTKVEVRFRDSQQLYRQLLSMLRSKFLSMDLDSDLRVRAPASESRHSPPDSARQRELQIELSGWAKDQLAQIKPLGSGPISPAGSGSVESEGQIRDPRTGPPMPMGFDRPSGSVTNGEPPPSSVREAEGETASGEGASEYPPPNENPLGPDGSANVFRGDEPVSSPAPSPHSAVYRAMQIHDCYLVVETEDGLTVIDQHALHERVMYEHLRERVLSGDVESQRMLIPETVELSPREAALLLEHADVLKQLGLSIEEFGGSTILLTGYPVMLAKADLVQLVRDIADQLDGAEKKPTRRDILDELLHMMSCKAAVKAGQRLAPEEIDSLLAQRHLIDDAHHCPHGRPTALVLSRSELDRQFGRLG